MKRRRDRNVFDEPTVRYEGGAVPTFIDDDEDTRPVDVDEMAQAARRSRDFDDPHEDPSVTIEFAEPPRAEGTPVPATRPSPRGPGTLYAELACSAVDKVLTLPVHRVSSTGVSLEVPPDVTVVLAVDTAVTVFLNSATRGANALRARVPALVAHHRLPRGGVPGGLSLRWDTERGTGQRELDQVLEHMTIARS
jgi:hypothetical protein